MKINFQHNTLVRETITEGFLRYVNESLVPKLTETYGDGISEALFYENTLNLDLSRDGKRYYPLTLLIDAEPKRQWISWEFPKAHAFLDENPFAYISNAPLEFFLEEDVPEEFLSLVERIPLDYSRESLPISVELTTGSIGLLVGRYSQAFLDEMARQLTVRIEESQNVRGVARSNIRLTMTFAPMTFMEHNCDGMIYRRLLMSEEGGRAEKDFWVSWHRANSDAPVSISEDIAPGEVIFLIGEDVPQKVREKEFRYLTRQNAEKYRSSMGRKTVTEWHEFLKKALKRGELSRRETIVQDPTPSSIPENTEIPSIPAEVVEPVTAPTHETDPVVETTAPVEELTSQIDEENDPLLALLRQIAESEEEARAENTPAQTTTEESAPEEYLDAMSLLRDFVGREEASEATDAQSEEVIPEGDESEPLVELTADETEAEQTSAEEIAEETSSLEEDPSMFGSEPIQETIRMPEMEEESRFDEPLLIEEIAPLPTYIAPGRKSNPAQEEMSFDTTPAPVEEVLIPSHRPALMREETPAPVAEVASSTEEPTPTVEPVAETATPIKVPTPVAENITPTEELAPARSTGIYTSEAVLTRRIRESLLREIEMRDKERLAEEARRAVLEKQEREAEMQRIARERREAEIYRQEIAELREQVVALAEEVRMYTDLCQDAMLEMSVRKTDEENEADLPAVESVEEMVEESTAEVASEVTTESVEEFIEDVAVVPTEEGSIAQASEETENPTENIEKTYTQSEVERLLTEQENRLMAEMEARISAMLSAVQVPEVISGESFAEEITPVESCEEPVAQMESEDAPLTSVSSEDVIVGESSDEEDYAPSTSVIEELLFDDAREAVERERIAEMQKIIDERQEKLEALRREEEERRERVAELARKQEELEAIARQERARQEEENRRLEEERRAAEALALQTYESHLREARRLEEELELAQKRREEEDARIREAEERIEEQRRLAEQAREEQIRKNEQTRRLTAEAEERLSEIYRATELGREIAERTEEESRLATETIAQEAERIREETLRHEQEARQRAEAERLVLARGAIEEAVDPHEYNYVSRLVHLSFDRPIDPNLMNQIQRLMGDTIAYFNKASVPISVRAEMTGQTTLDLNFVRIPKEEEPLLINIVKVLGRSNIGIRKAKIDDE